MDFNIILGVSQEELAEFPDSQQPTGTVVPNCQDSLQTTSLIEENTIEEETIKERGTSLTTESSAQGSIPPISSGNPRHPESRFSHSVDDPCRNREMAEPSRGSKGGKDVKEHIDPTKLPTDPVALLQMQVAEQMELVNKVVLTLRSLPTGGPGGGGGGDSDPDSSDSQDSDGEPKARGPRFYARKRKKMRRAIKQISPPNFQRRTWRETRSSPSQGTGLVRCNWNCNRQGHAQEFQAHTGWQCQGMVRRSLGQGEAHPNMGRAYQLLLPVFFYPGAIPHPSS